MDIANTPQEGAAALLAEYLTIPLEVDNNGHVIEVRCALEGEPTNLMRMRAQTASRPRAQGYLKDPSMLFAVDISQAKASLNRMKANAINLNIRSGP